MANSAERTEHEIPVFARSHGPLVIAQWISTIDKIARKPKSDKKPTAQQREFRQRLGEACWQRIIDGGYLPEAEGSDLEILKKLWWYKIHPYRDGTEDPDQDGKRTSSATQGRHYSAFAGEGNPEQANVSNIANRIEIHLYGEERRLGPNLTPKSKGKIEGRAQSIAKNILSAAKRRPNPHVWTDDDIRIYLAPGDPAKKIHDAAVAREKEKKRVDRALAGKILFKHWALVFRADGADRPMDVREASTAHPGMFALHNELKTCYARLLKRTRKGARDQRNRKTKGRSQRQSGRSLSALMPVDFAAARRLFEAQDANADLAHLVRLGRVIHYTASDGRPDRTAAVDENWPSEIDRSRFWTSHGQAEIKRAEAFVRIWRHAFVHAGLTLKDWVSMRAPFPGDILGGEAALRKALDPKQFERAHFDRKLLLLFGSRTHLFDVATPDQCLGFLGKVIKGAATLRHAVFHFKGRGYLLDTLANLPQQLADQLKVAHRLWEIDAAERTDRLKGVLRAASVEQFLDQGQLDQVFRLVAPDGDAELPLPRMSRLLQRAADAWAEDETISLPEPANRRALEAPTRLCQYTALKLIYERPFRAWLAGSDTKPILEWIERAIARRTEAARRLNARGNELAKQMMSARTEGLPRQSAGSDIRTFFFDLSAATASEMRVQQGYESDRQAAREQAEYIDELLRDVVIQSFSLYLTEQKLDWILKLLIDQPLPTQPISALAPLQAPESARPADWQAALYLILHLLSVETVGRLLHQLYKWEITAGRERDLDDADKDHLQQLFAAMKLYLDMHDAKFEGITSLVGCSAFRELFESGAGFDRVFPRELSPEADQRLPRRGLREIMRFGHLPVIKVITRARKVDDSVIACVFADEARGPGGASEIAVQQKQREDLHDTWVKAKRLDVNQLQAYCEALAKVSKHRLDSGFVNLVDHVRAHRLIMRVLGRLVDYAGLFERDLYFAALALIHRAGLRPNDLLSVKGLRLLREGQVIFALREASASSNTAGARIFDELGRIFSEGWKAGTEINRIRNGLAHLNMLQGDAPSPQLTHWINRTRQLMAYDRKLKNAVSKSIIDLMADENLEIRWTMGSIGDVHELTDAILSTHAAPHLGKMRTLVPGREHPLPITEVLLSDGYVAMVAEAFGGRAQRSRSIIDIAEKIDWQVSVELQDSRRGGKREGPGRPRTDQRSRGQRT